MQWLLHLQPRVWATQASRHFPPHMYWWALVFIASMTSPFTWRKQPVYKRALNGSSYLQWAAITCNNLMLDIYLTISLYLFSYLSLSLCFFSLFTFYRRTQKRMSLRGTPTWWWWPSTLAPPPVATHMPSLKNQSVFTLWGETKEAEREKVGLDMWKKSSNEESADIFFN